MHVAGSGQSRFALKLAPRGVVFLCSNKSMISEKNLINTIDFDLFEFFLSLLVLPLEVGVCVESLRVLSSGHPCDLRSPSASIGKLSM